MNNIVFIVIDSARYDHVVAAKTPSLRKIGKIEKRYSYASWTSPSHFVYLMGLLPHLSPKKTFASNVYKSELLNWKTRVGASTSKKISYVNFLPSFSLPEFLKKLGYSTHAFVSMPLLNPSTSFANFFDSYKLMSGHNQFHKIIKEISFEKAKKKFYFLNLGEAHYPYCLEGESDLPHIHGFHGTIKHMGDIGSTQQNIRFFTKKDLARMKTKQIHCIEHIDTLLEELIQKSPPNTYFIVTSDHGELFGEDGFFGHGPIFHEKVFEVPLVEGMRP